ncbi:MAG: NYN domain-containing protein [Oscillospiraceae bacterium]|nr:NYN domain-containing protein [Oscillospiraceae bacterium]MBR2805198.1 NYN domain-containing protein [Oscillospiraceae bacterium]
MAEEKKMAVLIDADNVSADYIGVIFEELANYPYTVTYKHIYGDWTNTRLAGWKKVLLDYSITPIQQYSYTTGKNATDSALIIDAMDIMYSGRVDAFCIVSSDSDFTRLASRLRESGMFLIGMGEKKTPKPFISACEVFKYLEVIAKVPEPEPVVQTSTGKKKKTQKEKPLSEDSTKLINLIRKIVDEGSDEDGWMNLGRVANTLQKRIPDYDIRNYGYSKLKQLVIASNRFKIESRPAGEYAPITYIANK